MSNEQPDHQNHGTPSQQPQSSPPFPPRVTRRRVYVSPAFPTSDHAVSQADGAA